MNLILYVAANFMQNNTLMEIPESESDSFDK